MTNEELKKLKHAYWMQKFNCAKRKDRNGSPIEMKLSFEEWLTIWERSGKLHLRGARTGNYVMSRFNDLGHYEVGNVAIILHSQNISVAQSGKKPTAETQAKRVAKIKDKKFPRTKEYPRACCIACRKETVFAVLAAHHSNCITEADRRSTTVLLTSEY